VLIQPDKQRVIRVFSVTQGDMLQNMARENCVFLYKKRHIG